MENFFHFLKKDFKKIIALYVAFFIATGFFLYRSPKLYRFTLTVSSNIYDNEIAASRDKTSLTSLISGSGESSNPNPFDIYLALMNSENIAHEINKDLQFSRILFSSQWDEKKKKWKSQSFSIIRFVKNLLDYNISDEFDPNLAFKNFIKSSVKKRPASSSNFMEITLLHTDPALAEKIIRALHQSSNLHIRKKYLKSIENIIAFTYEKLEETPISHDQRLFLIKRLIEQEQKKILYQSIDNFAADVLEANLSDTPEQPRFMISFLLSFMLSCLLVTLMFIYKYKK